jgi:hypothetical protein
MICFQGIMVDMPVRYLIYQVIARRPAGPIVAWHMAMLTIISSIPMYVPMREWIWNAPLFVQAWMWAESIQLRLKNLHRYIPWITQILPYLAPATPQNAARPRRPLRNVGNGYWPIVYRADHPESNLPQRDFTSQLPIIIIRDEVSNHSRVKTR